jgi:protein-disulfide isomerase
MSNSLRLCSLLLAGTLALGGGMARADDAPATSSKFDEAVKDVLMRNPEIVEQALEANHAKQVAKQEADAAAAITTQSSRIYDDKNSPVAGNPDGKETLVEFFDYSCHYCKQIHPDLKTLLKDDPNVKIIFKDFPILGPGSTLAAKAAMAANMQGKYLPMHDALLEYKGQFDNDSLKQIAESAGVDYDQMKADMDKPEIDAMLKDNLDLATTLNIHGTPSMIINHQFVGGALPLDALKQKLTENKAG